MHTKHKAIADFLHSSHKKGLRSVSLYPENELTAEQIACLKRFDKAF
jgi:hypothetical protein